MDVADVVDSSANCIQQSGAAAGEVFLLGHTGNYAQRQAVMDDYALVVEDSSILVTLLRTIRSQTSLPTRQPQVRLSLRA